MSNILGVYASFEGRAHEDAQKSSERVLAFREYLWGENAKGGLAAKLKTLKHSYGEGLSLILFQFKVLPLGMSASERRVIENFRPKEKSIGAWIPIDDKNFFSKNAAQRDEYISKEMTEILTEIKARLDNRKLNVDIQRLISDTQALFDNR